MIMSEREDREPVVRFRFIMWNSLQDVRVIATAVRTACEELLGRDKAAEVEIGLVEAVNNVIIHGYGAERGLIAIDVIEQPREVVLVVEDSGHPATGFDFQPREPAPVELMALQDLPEGGFGISLMHQCFDALGYHSRDQKNRLTLVKTFAGMGDPLPASRATVI